MAQVRVIKEDQKSLEQAVEQFGSKTAEEISDILLETFEGHLRGILGTMNVEEIFMDRERFATEVREVAATDVSKMGIRILSFVIKDIRDSTGYLEAIGLEQAAKIRSKADIEQAQAERDAFVREQECSKE